MKSTGKGSNEHYNSHSDLTNGQIDNKNITLMSEDNFKEQIDGEIELKYVQFQCNAGKFQNLEQNVEINNSTNLENSVIIKEEIIIPDVLESELQNDELIKEEEISNNQTMNWSNAKSILKSKNCKRKDKQEQISVTNVTYNQLIIQRKSENNFSMIVGIVDTSPPPSEIEVSVQENKRVPVFFHNDENSSKNKDNTEHLESESEIESSMYHEKRFFNQISEIEMNYIRALRKYSKMNVCLNGFLIILKNIAKLKQEKIMKPINLKESHGNIPKHTNQSRSLLKNNEINNSNVTENIEMTNLANQTKSILKPRIHTLDTATNKIIIMRSESTGKTELFSAKKFVTPSKIIEQIKSQCLLFCSDCKVYRNISWEDGQTKCTACSREMKYKCSKCNEMFSSSVQFYVHDMCFCKVKLESRHYWKCNKCNYLVHKLTNCHEKFCKKHPLLKCKYCSAIAIHLSTFTKYSLKESSIKDTEKKLSSSTDEDNLGIELDCTPLSSMPGQKVNSEKNFTLVCPADCKRSISKSQTDTNFCLQCGLVMKFKCLKCNRQLKSLKAILRHCSWCCSSVRIYYCMNCDAFTQLRYGKAFPAPAPAASATYKCQNRLAVFDMRGKPSFHRENCDESGWLQCGLCPTKRRTPRLLRVHLEEAHRHHANVGVRARVFKFAVQAWKRSTDLFHWRVEKISDSEKNRLKNEKIPIVLLERLSDHAVQNLINGQELRTYEITDEEDTYDEVGYQSTVERPSFFNSQQTAFMNNINSLLAIPDSDEEVASESNNMSFERNEISEVHLKTEDQSHNKTTRPTEKLSKHKVEKSTIPVRRRKLKRCNRRESLRCEHCSYLTNAKKELLEHIMSRHAARLFRGVGFDCPRCNCVFNNYHIYERHLQSRHRQR